MSTRASIVYAGPIHIYQETNAWAGDGKFEICICDLDGWPKCDYNGDVKIPREYLVKMHKELGEFLRDEGLIK